MEPALVALFNATISAIVSQNPNVTYVSTGDVAKMISDCNSKTILFDSRTDEEYQVSHLPMARKVLSAATGSDIQHYIHELKIDSTNPVVVYCFSSRRATEFAKVMQGVVKERKEFEIFREEYKQFQNHARVGPMVKEIVRQSSEFDSRWE